MGYIVCVCVCVCVCVRVCVGGEIFNERAYKFDGEVLGQVQ